jgi:hypothetical protein
MKAFKLAAAFFGVLALALWAWILYSLQFYPFAPSPSIIYVSNPYGSTCVPSNTGYTNGCYIATPNNACFINGIWTLCPWPAPWQLLYPVLVTVAAFIIVAIIFSAVAGWLFYKGTKQTKLKKYP